MHSTYHTSSWEAALYQDSTGATFWWLRRRLVLAKEVSVPLPNTAYYCHVRSAASEPAAG